MILYNLIDLAAQALYIDTGWPISRCQEMVRSRACFFTMMREPAARQLIITLARDPVLSLPAAYERSE